MLRKKLILALFMLASMGSSMAWASSAVTVPTLSVRGEAILKKPADQLILNIGVVTQAVEAEAALSANSEKMEKVIRALEELGLSNKEYQTGTFSIYPTYSQRPHDAPPEWSPIINGYQVNNSLTIETEKLDIAGKIIDVASKAGANNVNSVAFGLKDKRKYRSEVIHKATAHALKDAHDLAQAAGLRLERILQISLDDAEPEPFSYKAAPMGYARMSEQAATPIEAGEIEVRASVLVAYEVDKS